MNPFDFSASLNATPPAAQDGTFGSAQNALADFNSTITGAQAVPAANVPAPNSLTPAVATSGWQTLNTTIGNLAGLAGNLVQAGQQLQQQGAALPQTVGIVPPQSSAAALPVKTILIVGGALFAVILLAAALKRSA